MGLHQYEVLNVIGEGAYGVVLRCRDKETNTIVAIKRFKSSEDDEAIERISIREVKMLRLMQDCSNVVKLFKAFKHKGRLYLVFGYAEHNMLEVLEESPKGIPLHRLRLFVYQILKALAFVHQNGVLHRDIKPENLLVTKDDTVLLCDFGFARKHNASEAVVEDVPLTQYVATRWYRSSSLLLGIPYTSAVDIWATGCVMAELATGEPLFPGDSDVDQLNLIVSSIGPLPSNVNDHFQRNPRFRSLFNRGKPPNRDEFFRRFQSVLSPSGVDLLTKMLDLDENNIISAADALKHPFFEGIATEPATAPSSKSESLPLTRQKSLTSINTLTPTPSRGDRSFLPAVNTFESSVMKNSRNRRMAHLFRTGLSNNGVPPAPVAPADPYGFGAIAKGPSVPNTSLRGFNTGYSKNTHLFRHRRM
ncbi:hypothetical protein P9112_006820 [Eukaryota sp. TZLM1-RC]